MDRHKVAQWQYSRQLKKLVSHKRARLYKRITIVKPKQVAVCQFVFIVIRFSFRRVTDSLWQFYLVKWLPLFFLYLYATLHIFKPILANPLVVFKTPAGLHSFELLSLSFLGLLL